ncbi:HAD-like domain-containing protein [Hyaloraphidium curvatum]|nr:HAD-like domain-containing protein [Hyaloraphidium curvatum]
MSSSSEVDVAPSATVTHVLFDMDGLLLDTERIYTEVTQSILFRFGKEYTFELKTKLMGLPSMAAAQILVEETGVPMTAQEYLDERNAKQLLAFRESKKMPGAHRLVEHLAAKGVPIAVASSSHRDMYNVKAANNSDLFELFGEHITLGNDPEIKGRGKPEPDIYLLAARRLGVPPGDEHRCLVFEDAPAGVKAGLAAGMRVVWVPDRRMELDPELLGPEVEVMYSLEEFRPERYGLPPFDPIDQ